MLTTPLLISSEEHFQLFVEKYNVAFGDHVLSIEFIKGCDEVFMFFDKDGNAVGGYSINTEQTYRLTSFAPDVIAAHLRKKAEGLPTYELGTIWVEESRRNGREKLEVWMHIFGSMISRADQVMIGATESEEIYHFYHRYGMKLAYFGPLQVHGDTLTDAWIIYTDDVLASKVPEMYEALKKRFT